MTILVIIDLLMTRQILPRESEREDIMFILTVVICYGVGSWILFRFTERISSTIRNRSRFFKVVHQFAIIIQISLFGILLLIIFGNLASCYDYFSYCMNTRPLAVSVNAIASGAAGVILGLIAYKFFAWYRVNKRNFIVLLFGLRSLAGAFNVHNRGRWRQDITSKSY